MGNYYHLYQWSLFNLCHLESGGIPRGSPQFIETRNFKNFTEAKFIDDIKNTIWQSPNNEDNINIVWEEWKLKILSILDKHMRLAKQKEYATNHFLGLILN